MQSVLYWKGQIENGCTIYEHCDEILKEKTAHLGIHATREDIIHSFDNAKGTNGSM